MTGGEKPEGARLDALTGAANVILAREYAMPLAPGLHIVATPIGNLADMSLRALAVLARAGHICCEDTRHSLKLLTAYGLGGRLTAYHEHNAARERPRILKWLSEGASVALISDAGTPLIADPGYKLVRAVIEAGHPVHTVPGPSAAIAALAVSGLPTDAFHFAGFLPPKEAARRKRLKDLAGIPATLILYETAQRLPAALTDLAAVLGGREVVIAREMTKRFEEIIRGTLPVTLEDGGENVRGEIVILVAPPGEKQHADEEIREAISRAMASMSLRDAVDEVTRTLRVPRRVVYNLALELRTD